MHVHFNLLNDNLLHSSHHHSWNLHSVWDTGIIEVVLEREYNNSRQVLEEDLYAIPFRQDDCKLGTNLSCVIQWGKESWDLALESAYVLSDNVTQVCSGSTIDNAYYESRLPVVKEQLVLAGFRLAATLEAIAIVTPQKEDNVLIPALLWHQAWKSVNGARSKDY
eukprot:scaffold2929_cov107-Cylindrotheca_fusiformis.AAC.9